MTPKELFILFAELEEQGFTVEKTRSGHFKVVPPDKTKRIVYTASTPSDRRGLANFIRDVKHAGFQRR